MESSRPTDDQVGVSNVYAEPWDSSSAGTSFLSDFVRSVFREGHTSGPFTRGESPTVHEEEHDIVVRRQRVTPKCVEMKRGGSSPPRRLEVRCSIQLSYRRVRDLRYTGSTARRVRRSYAEVLHRPTADESFDSRLEVIRCQVRVPLDHAECPPAAEVLHRPQVNTCHDEPGRERVLPCPLERDLSPLDGLWEELVGPRVAADEHQLGSSGCCGAAPRSSSSDRTPCGLLVERRDESQTTTLRTKQSPRPLSIGHTRGCRA